MGTDFSFDEAPINYKKELADYGEIGETLFTEHQNKLELDNLNLLYVALTRASDQLYIFAEKPAPTVNNIPKSYNQFFGAFLKQSGKWSETQLIYEFGDLMKSTTNNSA